MKPIKLDPNSPNDELRELENILDLPIINYIEGDFCREIYFNLGTVEYIHIKFHNIYESSIISSSEDHYMDHISLYDPTLRHVENSIVFECLEDAVITIKCKEITYWTESFPEFANNYE